VLGWFAGRVRVRSVGERAKFIKLLRVRGGFKFCGCGVGAGKKFQPAQDSETHTAFLKIFRVVHEQKDKKVLEIPTSEIISHVLTIPAYLWLNSNHLRNFYQMA